MPEPIPDTPENAALALATTPLKDDDGWDYLQETKDQGRPWSLSYMSVRRRPRLRREARRSGWCRPAPS